MSRLGDCFRALWVAVAIMLAVGLMVALAFWLAFVTVGSSQ